MKFVENPLINKSTLLIAPYQITNDLTGSYVLENSTEYYTHLSPKQLIDKSCKYFGSSLQGRIEGTKEVFGASRKPPISIEPLRGLYFLPTSSPNSENCVWLAHSHIDYLEKIKPKKTRVHFRSGRNFDVNVSHISLNNQIQRTAQYRHLLSERLLKNYELERLEINSPFEPVT